MTSVLLPRVDTDSAWRLVLEWCVRDVDHDVHKALRLAVSQDQAWQTLYRTALRLNLGDRSISEQASGPTRIVRAPDGLSAFAPPARLVRLPHRGSQAKLVLKQEEGCVVATAGSQVARAPLEKGSLTLTIDSIAGQVTIAFSVIDPGFESAIEVIGNAFTDGTTGETCRAAEEYLRWAEPVLRSAAERMDVISATAPSDNDIEDDLEWKVEYLLRVRLEVESSWCAMSTVGQQAVAQVDAGLWDHRRGVMIVDESKYFDLLREYGLGSDARSVWWTQRARFEARIGSARIDRLLTESASTHRPR